MLPEEPNATETEEQDPSMTAERKNGEIQDFKYYDEPRATAAIPMMKMIRHKHQKLNLTFFFVYLFLITCSRGVKRDAGNKKGGSRVHIVSHCISTTETQVPPPPPDSPLYPGYQCVRVGCTQ